MRQRCVQTAGVLACLVVATLAYDESVDLAAEHLGITPLHQAAGRGDEAAVKTLLKAGAYVNARESLVRGAMIHFVVAHWLSNKHTICHDPAGSCYRSRV